MPIIRLTTYINAPVEVCFDLARSIDFHVESLRHTGETAVSGKTSGLIGPGEQVTWRAHHFITQELTSGITLYDRPRHFRDSMIQGAFKRFDHDHHFSPDGQQTIIIDEFDFESPLGAIGSVANFLFLTRYMTRMLETRNKLLKETAESEALRNRFLPPKV